MTDSTRYPTASDTQTDTYTAAGGDPARDGGSVVLLHVEPDARSAELLTAFAEQSVGGFTVRSADGMEAALDLVDGVDCVVTEQRLPDGSGVELVDQLRERDIDVPVVFHTTCREDGTKAHTLEAGADDYFSKRPERGHYDRILERLHELADDGPQNPGAATTVTPDAPRSSVRPSQSEE